MIRKARITLKHKKNDNNINLKEITASKFIQLMFNFLNL